MLPRSSLGDSTLYWKMASIFQGYSHAQMLWRSHHWPCCRSTRWLFYTQRLIVVLPYWVIHIYSLWCKYNAFDPVRHPSLWYPNQLGLSTLSFYSGFSAMPIDAVGRIEPSGHYWSPLHLIDPNKQHMRPIVAGVIRWCSKRSLTMFKTQRREHCHLDTCVKANTLPIFPAFMVAF